MQMRKLALSLLLLGMAGSVAHAEDLSGTLKKIKDNGVIVVGHRESSVPFSYYDNQQKLWATLRTTPTKSLKLLRKSNAPNLQVKMLPITSQNRIPLLQNGTYDFECGSTTNNLERQKQAAFSDTIFVVGTRLLVKKGSDIKDFKDGRQTGGGHLRYHLRSAAEQTERQRQNEHAHHQRQGPRRLLPYHGKRARRGLHDG